ncbi:MFS general substrate transporter [Sporormia fimetaria CBS 119925]|uniref:MFS general substrate transporter n=1 Tax=Sporormia fimetaria CBS 119925 TaxID=1340428 RepID=A0A6A6VP66_9PLEO|nr:MFS general substrate transporter [Sporormia fimetaria CBS 119925]
MARPAWLLKLTQHGDKPPFLLKYRSSNVFIVTTVALAVFTDLFLYGVIVPVMPYAMEERMDIKEDEAQSKVSTLIAIYGAATLVASPVCGWLADRSSSRRSPLLLGLLALTGATVLLNVATNMGYLIAGRLLQGVSAAVVWTVGLALLADTVPQEHLAQAMGYVALAMSAGILVSPILGGVVFDKAGYNAVFGMCYALLGVDVLLRLLLVEKKVAVRWDPNPSETAACAAEEPSPSFSEKRASHAPLDEESGPEYDPTTKSTRPGISEASAPDPVTPHDSTERHVPEKRLRDRLPPIVSLLYSRRLLAALFAAIIQSSLITAFDGVLTIYVRDLFNFSATAAGLLFLPLVIPSFISPVAGWVADRFGGRYPASTGFLLATIPLVCLRFVDQNTLNDKVLLCALLALIGLTLDFTFPPLLAEITHVVDQKEKKMIASGKPGYGKGGAYAQAYALFNVAFAAGCTVGPLVAGAIVDSAGWATMSLVLGLLSAVTTVPVFLYLGGWFFARKKKVEGLTIGLIEQQNDLFKNTNAATKRKFEHPSDLDPTQAYKSAKLDAHSGVKRSPMRASVDEDDDDDEAGPSLPPDFAPEDGDDEEGRFFGGGLDENAIDAIDYLDAHDAEEAIVEDKFDTAWVRKLAVGFERKINKNAEMRAKHEDDPAKFMASEGDLDESIKSLSILSEHPELYEEFVKTESAARLVELLAHENTDIAIGAIEIISELTDDDVEAEQEQWDVLVGAMLEAGLLSLLISNFTRFDESEEADRSGVYHSLSVIENLLSQPANVDMIGKETKLLKWLLGRIQKEETRTSQNKLYASEILSILTQSSSANRRRIASENGVEIILTQLAPYRRSDPEKESEEEEYMENLFDTLTLVVEESEGKSQFLEAEGVELCLLMVRDGKTSKSRALKVLDHACGYAEPTAADESANGTAINQAAAVCEKVVEARGLKPIFSTFMKTKKHDAETTEHILGIFASMLRSLPADTDARLRVLAKFLEKDYEKITKLVALRREYASRVAAFDAKIAAQKKGLSKSEIEEFDLQNVAERLSEGVYALQRADVILAWLVAEDDGAKKAIVKELGDRDEGLEDVRRTLREQLDGVLEVERAEREMLETLVEFLR